MSYDQEADDLRWELEQERRAEAYDHQPRRRTRYRCGGYASSTGHCGALDCDRCHPGWDDDTEDAP